MEEIKKIKSLLEYFDSDKSYDYDGLKSISGVIYNIGDVRICRFMNPITKQYIDLPVQVFGIYKNDHLSPPLYDIRMIISWSEEYKSGFIEIKNFALWRYELERDPTDEEKDLFKDEDL